MHKLIRIVGPSFVAGVVVGMRCQVVRAAPIVYYMQGWDVAQIRRYVRRRGWTLELI
jgi:hypothetical protein